MTEHAGSKVRSGTICIRRREDVDLAELEAVAERVRSVDGYPIFLPGENCRRFLERPAPVAAWVAERNGRIVGQVGLNESTSRPTMELVSSDQAGLPPIYVARLLVDPDCRRHGLGGLLLEQARTEAVERRRAPYLDVVDTESAAPAIALYRRMGWTQVGRVNFELAGDRMEELVFRGPTVAGDPA